MVESSAGCSLKRKRWVICRPRVADICLLLAQNRYFRQEIRSLFQTTINDRFYGVLKIGGYWQSGEILNSERCCRRNPDGLGEGYLCVALLDLDRLEIKCRLRRLLPRLRYVRCRSQALLEALLCRFLNFEGRVQ